MRRDFDALGNTTFDLAVIGGGIQGATTARDAALRGLKVAVVDALDFAGATSSRSTKLLHGGLRYLEQFEFRLVHEARTERARLLRLAPHLARPVPFVLPIYQGDPYFPLKIRLGLTVYDLLGNLGRGDRHRMLSPAVVMGLVPGLRREGLRAAAVYHDSQTDDARLTLENLLDAAEHGAAVVNYARVRSLGMEAGPKGARSIVTSAEVEDVLGGHATELRARYWVNATGPWVDHLRALVPGFDGSKTVRLTKGTHLHIPRVTGEYALLAAVGRGPRVFLIVPWHGCAILGTTDTDYTGDPAAVAPDQADTDYLLDAANRVLGQPLTRHDVSAAWAGLRALALEPGKAGAAPSDASREYRFHEDAWATNFVSICGGKLTTARALGEKLASHLIARLRHFGARVPGSADGYPTRSEALPGGKISFQKGGFEAFVKETMADARRDYGVPGPVAERVVRTYGSRWRQVLDLVRQDHFLGEPLPGSPAILPAEVEFSIREEMAMKAEDFLRRRSGLNWTALALPAETTAAVEEIFARHFGSRCGEPQAETQRTGG